MYIIKSAQEMREELIQEGWMVTASGVTNLEIQDIYDTLYPIMNTSQFEEKLLIFGPFYH